jgi:hypothetical protein
MVASGKLEILNGKSGSRLRARRQLAWGFGAIALYLAAALVSFRGGLLPARPLYDGIAPPQPYRWVNPPPELASGNLAPESGSGEVPLTKKGSDAVSVATADRQASLVFAPNAVTPRAGEKKVRVLIDPLDPATLGRAPKGLEYDGNAYRFEASYARSGEPIALAGPPLTVVLRYALGATELFRREGNVWVTVKTLSGGGPLEIAGDTTALGTFVAAGPPLTDSGGSRVWDVVAAAAGLVVVIAGVLFARRRKHKRARAARLRAMGKKSKKPEK